MIDWLKVEDKRKKLVYEQVAANEGLPPIAIEKDFWVTLVLESVFELGQAENMVFKGGTSLSKGWNLIQRFSEDVDLAVDRKAFGFDGKLGSSKRTRLRKAIREFVLEELTPELINNLQEKEAEVDVEVWESENSDEDPSTIEVRFPAVTESVKYLPPRVLIEINARSLIEPNEHRELTPLVGSVFPQLKIDLIPVKIPCVLPRRTFLEKVFLLHEEFQKNPDEMRAERLSRHLYDVEAIMDTNHGKEALDDVELYMDIIHHRKHLTKISGIDYDKHLPGSINLAPPEASIKQWQDDYHDMQESMIHGDSLSFDKLIDRMKELTEKINQLDFKGEMKATTQIVDTLGNKELLKLRKTAFLCSRKIPASAVLKCYDWAIEQREKGNCVISGFHSELEKDVFHYLAKGEQPIILVLPRGLKTRWEPELKELLESNRLLIITPFDTKVKRVTKETALVRNRLMVDLADEIVVGYQNPSGNLKALFGSIDINKSVSYLVEN